MKIQAPKITKQLFLSECMNEIFYNAQEEQSTIFQTKFINQALEEPNLSHIEIRNCVFEKAFFEHFSGRDLYFLDVLFENCDFSNSTFSKSLFRRVEFKNCKLIGASFDEVTFDQVQFNECQLSFLNMSLIKSKGLLFSDCDLNQASFLESNLQKVYFNQCQLMRSEFLHARLKDVDLSTSNIEGIKTSLEDLKGVVVSTPQALILTSFLQIKIKD